MYGENFVVEDTIVILNDHDSIYIDDHIVKSKKFKKHNLVEKVKIPNGIYAIKSYSFGNCTNLKTLTIGTGTKKNRISSIC